MDLFFVQHRKEALIEYQINHDDHSILFSHLFYDSIQKWNHEKMKRIDFCYIGSLKNKSWILHFMKSHFGKNSFFVNTDFPFFWKPIGRYDYTHFFQNMIVQSLQKNKKITWNEDIFLSILSKSKFFVCSLESIHFFSSLIAKSFPILENKNEKWNHYHYYTIHDHHFHYDLSKINKNSQRFESIHLLNPFDHQKKAIDLTFYRIMNPDLWKYRKNKLKKHFFQYGHHENRIFNQYSFYQKYPFFDIDFYKKTYSDVKNFTSIQIMAHYHIMGVKQNRKQNDGKNNYNKPFIQIHCPDEISEHESDILHIISNQKNDDYIIENNSFENIPIEEPENVRDQDIIIQESVNEEENQDIIIQESMNEEENQDIIIQESMNEEENQDIIIQESVNEEENQDMIIQESMNEEENQDMIIQESMNEEENQDMIIQESMNEEENQDIIIEELENVRDQDIIIEEYVNKENEMKEGMVEKDDSESDYTYESEYSGDPEDYTDDSEYED